MPRGNTVLKLQHIIVMFCIISDSLVLYCRQRCGAFLWKAVKKKEKKRDPFLGKCMFDCSEKIAVCGQFHHISWLWYMALCCIVWCYSLKLSGVLYFSVSEVSHKLISPFFLNSYCRCKALPNKHTHTPESPSLNTEEGGVLSGYKAEHNTDSDFHLLPPRLKRQKQLWDMKGERKKSLFLYRNNYSDSKPNKIDLINIQGKNTIQILLVCLIINIILNNIILILLIF